MARTLVLLAALAALSAAAAFGADDASPSAAGAASPETAGPAATVPAPVSEREPTAEEKAEKEARKACKVAICAIIASKNPVGDDVSCDIVKTWREAAITKMLGGKIDWPYGKAVCQSKLDLKREPLAKAMSEPKYEIVMPAQKLRCTLAQKKGGEPYAVEMSIAPKISFENGKATAASLNWGEASAPMLVYALIYAGTGIDNSTNVLGPEVVRMVNDFTSKKCAEVKDEPPGAKPN